MVTQKDIAAKANVSVAMVSRVLSGKAADIGASPSTIERIQHIAAEMGYRPSYAARVLKGAPSTLIGVAVVDFDDPFLSHVIQRLQTHAAKKGFGVMLAGSEEAPFVRFLQHPVSRMIVLGSSLNIDWLNDWNQHPIPLVQLGSGPDYPELNRICIDEFTGFQTLLTMLTENGTQRVVYLGPTTGIRAGRYQAFCQALQETNLIHQSADVLNTTGITLDQGAEAINRLPSGTGEVIALVCTNDQLALGAIHQANNLNLKIPEDIQIIGFDDIPMARYSTPPLTTLKQPIEDMVQALLNTEDTLPSKTLRFQPELQRRETTHNVPLDPVRSSV